MQSDIQKANVYMLCGVPRQKLCPSCSVEHPLISASKAELHCKNLLICCPEVACGSFDKPGMFGLPKAPVVLFTVAGHAHDPCGHLLHDPRNSLSRTNLLAASPRF